MQSKTVALKERKCKVRSCCQYFTPRNSMHCACSPVCALTLARAKREQAEQRQRSDERKKDREKRDKLKTRSDWIKDAQKAFNAFIRARDANHPCICCGQPLGMGDVGGAFDAGHYRSVGSAPHLRFEESNVHAQRKHCNRYGSGRAVDYRIGLINRIGLAAVEALESDQEPRRHTIEDLKQIIATYKAKTKELKERDTVAG